MIAPPIPPDENERLAELDQVQLLYTDPEQAFDRVTRQLAEIFHVPVAAMSLIGRDQQFFKSQVGLPPELASQGSVPRNLSICGHVVGNNQMLVVDDLASDPRFRDNPLVLESGARFYAGAPLRTDSGRAIGSLCIVDTQPRHLSQTEQQLLSLVADGLVAEIKLRHLSRRLVERNRLTERAMIEARHVQRFLLPPQQQHGDGFYFCHNYHPVEQIGGDFIDMRVRDDDSVIMLLADVSGHGPSAALTSAMAKTSFLRAAANTASPQELLTAINRDLARLVEPGRFMTAAAVVFDPWNRTAELSWAGHPYPFVIRQQSATLVETANDLPLLIEDVKIYTKSTTLDLEKGDRLLLYTDGATEATDHNGAFLDVVGLQRLLSQAAGFQGVAMLQRVFANIHAYADGKLKDDVALVCLEAV